MAVAITVPRLGWNMEEGTFVGWLKKEGEEVRPGDALFTLEGEKATEDIECLEKGVLHIPPASPHPGERVAVGAVIGYLTQPGEATPVGGAAPPAGREAAVMSTPAPPQDADPPPARGGPAASPRAARSARVGRRLDASPRRWTHRPHP